VEALGVAQLLDRLDDRFALLAGGDRLAPARQRSLAATVEWSYQLLDETEQRVFRVVSVFPAGFTLDGAEAVAGDGAGPVVLRLVDCSLLTPPRAGADGRSRYSMLETLRAYGRRLLDQAGEREQAAAALAGGAVTMAEQAAAGLQTRTGELDAARWLDAEDATIWQVLAWAAAQDTAAAMRLVAALGWWWTARGRLPAVYPLLREVAGRAELGSDGWCTAQRWLGYAAIDSADNARALEHFTAVRDAVADRPPSRALADALAGRSTALSNMDRTAEAAGEARRSLAMAREVSYPAGEVLALLNLSITATAGSDHGEAVRLAQQAAQITADVPGALVLLLTVPGPEQPQAPAGLGMLSERERELVTLVAQGRTNAQIAAQLYISVRTVSSHLDRIRDKTGCRRRAELTRLALTADLV
jgi:DNA-binding CsgD family transcriptional regulator